MDQMMPTVASWAPLTLPMLPLRDPQRGLSSLLGYEADTDGADAYPTTLTIAMVGSSSRWDPAAVAVRLAELAVTDELVVVHGSEEHETGASVQYLVTELRGLLPRYTIVALHLGPQDRPRAREAALLDDCLEMGGVPLVATRAGAVPSVAADLFYHLRVDRVVNVTYTMAGGAQLHEVFRRAGVAVTDPVSGADSSALVVTEGWR